MDAITKPAIYRLIKDGCTHNENLQISSLMYEEIRYVLQEYIENLIRKIVAVMNYGKVKTMSEKHVYMVLKDIQNIPASNKLIEQCPQNDNTECFYFPKASFKRFLTNIARDFRIDIKYSKEALNLIQFSSEHYLKTLLTRAIKNTRHAGRITLQPKDLQLSRAHCVKCARDTQKNDSLFVDYTSSIKKVLKQLYPDVVISLTKDAQEQHNILLNILAQAIVKQANDLLLVKKKTTIDAKAIKNSIYLVMKGELAKHAVSAGTRYVIKYEAKDKSKSDLVFSISRTKKIIKNYTKNRVSKQAVIFLTACLEYISAEINQLSGSVDNTKITGKNIYTAIKEDEELNHLVDSLGLTIVQTN